jgi:hypothetical protein
VIESIALRRGACMGTCPVYTATFRDDLSADWAGEFFVERIGSFVGRISREDLDGLADRILRDAFFSWPDTMPDATCTPPYEIEVRTSDGTKAVTQWDGSETRPFRALASAIDRLAERIDWTRIGDVEPLSDQG